MSDNEDHNESQEKFTILTQNEEELQKQMKTLSNINLDKMVELSLDQEALKHNFKTITDVLKKQFGLLNMCNNNIESMGRGKIDESEIDKMFEDQTELRELIMKLIKENEDNKMKIDELKEGSDGLSMDELKKQGLEMENRLSNIQNLLNRLGEQVDEQGNKKDHSSDLSKLQEMANALKQSQDEIINQRGNQGMTAQEQNEQLEKLKATVERTSETLQDKVTCDDFDNAMEMLRQIQNSQGGDVPVIQRVEVPKSRDGNRINALDERVKTLEAAMKKQQAMLNDLQNKMKEAGDDKQKQQQAVDDYFSKLAEKNEQMATDLEELSKKLKNAEDNKAEKTDLKKLNSDRDKMKKDLMEVINKVKESVNTNGLKCEQHSNDIEDLKRKFDLNNKKLGEMQRKQGTNNNQADMSQAQKLIDTAMEGLKEELGNMAKKLQEQLDKQDFEEDMLAYQQKIFQKTDEIVGALIKKLANKDDTKKALGYLEKKIAELYLLIQPEDKGKEMDGLLVKRPLFWSCVSCDKDLDQYQGRLGDYKNWKVFPPKETSPERMGRFGVGYNQMIQNRKQNIDKEKDIIKDKDNSQTATNTHATNGFPEIQSSDKNKYIIRK